MVFSEFVKSGIKIIEEFMGVLEEGVTVGKMEEIESRQESMNSVLLARKQYTVENGHYCQGGSPLCCPLFQTIRTYSDGHVGGVSSSVMRSDNTMDPRYVHVLPAVFVNQLIGLLSSCRSGTCFCYMCFVREFVP